MRPASPPIGPRRSHAVSRPLLRMLLACALGVAAALLISCASAGKGLIPSSSAGPLQSDFEAVARAAQSGGCAETNTALVKTERDFDALPSSVDAGLRGRLREGISKLRPDALEACKQPLPQATNTTSTQHTTTTTTTSTETTPTVTQTTSTQTTPPATTPAPSGPGGGTPAPGSEATPGAGGESESGVGGAGEAGGAGGSGGAKVGGGQEAGGK